MTDIPSKKDIKTLSALTDDSIMPFGEHKGKKLRDVPDNYLFWWFNEKDAARHSPYLYDYCEARLESYDPVADESDRWELDQEDDD